MPFVSRSQRKWMYATNPEMAARWQKETGSGKRLPEHAPKGRPHKKAPIPPKKKG